MRVIIKTQLNDHSQFSYRTTAGSVIVEIANGRII